MDSNFKRSLAVAATFSLLVACGPAPTANPGPSPSAGESAAPSAAPSADVSASPSASPSADASASPSAAPSATSNPDGSASPGSSPSPGSSASPSASATTSTDISTVESTTFNGKVYDDEGSPLNGVTVKVKSLSSGRSFEATATTSGGTYAFNNAPSGIQLEITASKTGYTTRRRVEVLKSNKDGDPDANRYDFGTEDGVEGDSGDFGIGYNGLSDKPEVVEVTPGRNASGVAPDTSFVIKFSEAMDTSTVEDNFAIYTATTELLSVDDGSLTNQNDPDTGDEVTFVGVEGTDASDDDAEGALDGDFHVHDIVDDSATLIYDDSDFDVSWNSDDTEVTFTFADEAHLPSDTESANLPDYLVTFYGVDDNQIKDSTGVTRDEGDGGYFKLTDGDFEMWYDFSIDTDEEEPSVLSVEATDDNAGIDEISVEYSEPMMLNTRAGQILGVDEESPLNPENYAISIEDGDQINWGTALNGSARFDSDDDTNSTVLLQSASVAASTLFGPTGPSSDINGPTNNLFITVTLADGEQISRTFDAVTLNPAVDTYNQLEDFIETSFGNAGSDMLEITDQAQTPPAQGTVGEIDYAHAAGGAGTADDYPGDLISFVLNGDATIGGERVVSAAVSGDLAEIFGITPNETDVHVFQATDDNGSASVFAAGESVTVTVSRSVADPAGNSVDSSNDEEEDTAN